MNAEVYFIQSERMIADLSSRTISLDNPEIPIIRHNNVSPTSDWFTAPFLKKGIEYAIEKKFLIPAVVATNKNNAAMLQGSKSEAKVVPTYFSSNEFQTLEKEVCLKYTSGSEEFRGKSIPLCNIINEKLDSIEHLTRAQRLEIHKKLITETL